ncbi:MAG: hypothetical protein ACOVJ8_05260 [Sediminibacterium sp.]|jgi:hypothetical protein
MSANNSWQKYVGLGTQLIVGLIVTLYIGKKGDEYLHLHNLLNWILPSLFILFTLYRIIKDTQSK